ncbi:MAG: hypothetical protein ABSF12_16655, partial [Bryobacteraceae bacterium]
QVEPAWVSTIDGFCARLLQENAVAAGIPPGFTVLDQNRAGRLARESMEDSLDQLFEENPVDMRRLLEALDLSTDDDGRKPDLAQSLLDLYESTRISGLEAFPTEEPADLWPEARRLARGVLDVRGEPGSPGPLISWRSRRLCRSSTSPSPAASKPTWAASGNRERIPPGL